MVIPAGLEPATSRFATECSHPPELRDLQVGWRDSNPLEPDSQTGGSPFAFSQHHDTAVRPSLGDRI